MYSDEGRGSIGGQHLVRMQRSCLFGRLEMAALLKGEEKGFVGKQKKRYK